jgi:hypothetical protein
LLLLAGLGETIAAVNDSGLDNLADLLAGSFKSLLGANLVKRACRAEVRKERDASFVEHFDFLRKKGGGKVSGIAFTKLNHTLLADVLGALEEEYILRLAAVFHEVFGLEFSLREVFNQNTGAHFASEVLDKGTDKSLFIITVGKTFVAEELIEVQGDHVSALAKRLS